jgi:hypothetical protein
MDVMAATKKKPCKQPDCELPKDSPSHFCYWHRVARLLIDDQIAEARGRLALMQAKSGYEYRASVPGSEWPEGRRFCSGCQFMIPKWYADGSRCKACASEARYGAHIRETYGITYDFYLALYQFQGGRCYICRKVPKSRRLAVDHDHETGEVRGLLCSGQRSCNHDVLGNITSIDMARRIVLYLEDPPARALKAGRALAIEVASASGSVMGGKSRTILPTAGAGEGTREVMQRLAAESIESRARRCWDGHYSDKSFWRFPDGHEGPHDIFHAIPDNLDPKVWEKRLELARERDAQIAARRQQNQGQE